jgi:hypothetical protein
MSSDSNNLILEPNDADVLCGRGRAIRIHSGNQLYISLITQQKAQYSTAVKGWKLEIVRGVVKAIRDQHGRFLTRQGSHWIDIGDQKAINKTAQAFRDLRSAEEDTGVIPRTSDNPQCVLAASATKKKKAKPGGRLGFFVNRLTSSGARPRTHTEDASDPSSSEVDSEEEEERENLPVNNGDVSETETEDSFPIYHGR